MTTWWAWRARGEGLGRAVAAALVGVAWFGVSPAAAQGPPPATVRVDAARFESVVNRRAVTGEVRAVRRSQIAAEVSGRVLRLDLRDGDAVTAGDVIAELDSRLAVLDVDRAAADLQAAEGLLAQRNAELDRAMRDLERMRVLDERGSANPRELDASETGVLTARALVTQAEAAVATAKADLGRARVRLDDKTIEAPFSGRVVRRLSEAGQWLSEGDAVVELVALDALEAYVDIPEQLVPFLPEAGREIELSAPGAGEAPLLGRVEAIAPVGDSLSRIFRLRLSVDAGGRRVLPGMSVRAMAPTGERIEAVTVHKDAILRDAAGAYVFMAAPMGGGPGGGPGGGSGGGGPSHQAAPLRVSILFAVGERVVVRPGAVQPGMALLVSGNERVVPTQPLVILNPEAMAGGGSGDGIGAGSEAASGGGGEG